MGSVEREDSPDAPGLDDDALDAALIAVFRRGPRVGENVLDAVQREGGPRPAIRLASTGPALGGTERAGTRSHSHYTFADELGRGGVGVVCRGVDVDLGREVALKVLRDEYVRHPQALTRFVEEAQIEGQLQHPGIVPVYELGVTEDGRPFFAMKLVEGKTLADMLAERKSPRDDRRRFLGIFEQICQAMACAHSRGVVHRDLKPSNVMVGSFGEVQVVDWGLAKVLGDVRDEPAVGPTVTTVRTEAGKGERAQTRVGEALGTPNYMPPEQARGDLDAIDERADVFALGAILLEILTGRPPYRLGAPDALVLAYRADLGQALRDLEACGADDELLALCRSCLEPERERRPRDAQAVADAVGAHLVGVEERAHRAEVAAAQARVKAREERKARRLELALASALLLAFLLGGGGYLLIRGEMQARTDEAGHAAASALGEAREQLGEARQAGVGDLAPWQAASAAARRARELAATGGAAPEVIASARRLEEEIEQGWQSARTESDRVARERATSRRLEEIRSRRGTSFSFLEAEADYAAAFREHGLDIDHMDASRAGAAIKASRIAGELCAALDDWAHARIRYSMEQAGRARHLLAVASAADPDPWRNQVRAAAAARDGRALQELRDAADLARQTPGALLVLANGLVDTLNVEAGVAVLEKVRIHHPTDFWIHYQLGFWLLNLREPRPQAALGSLQAAVALSARSVEARMQLAHALRALGRLDEAIDAWQELLELAPQHTDATLQLYRAMRDRDPGDLEALLPPLAAEADRIPENAFLHWRYATALRVLFRVKEAVEAYGHALRVQPDHAPSHWGLGFTHFYERYGMVDLGIAERHLAEAARLEPARSMNWEPLAKALSRQEKFAEAARAWEEARRVAPEIPRYHVRAVQAWFVAGDSFGALDAYRRLAERFPDHESLSDLELRLAHVFVQQYRKAIPSELARRAIARLKKGLEANTVHAPVTTHWIATMYCDVLDDFETAKSWFERALELSETAVDHMNLGLACARLGLHRSAIAQYRRAIELGLEEGRVWAFLGWTLALDGDLPGAVAALEEAEKRPDPFPWVDLVHGLALCDLGRVDEGRRILDRYGASAGWPAELEGAREAWPLFSANLREAARLRPAVEKGDLELPDARSQVILAAYCHAVGRYALACRCFEQAFAADPTLRAERLPLCDLTHPVDQAAQSAAALLSGVGQDARTLTEEERAHWRRAALGWMRAALDNWTRAVPDTLSPALAAATAIEWRRDTTLAPLREKRHLVGLPADEAAAFRAYWGRVDAFIAWTERLRDE